MARCKLLNNDISEESTASILRIKQFSEEFDAFVADSGSSRFIRNSIPFCQAPMRYIPEDHRPGNFTIHDLYQILLGR